MASVRIEEVTKRFGHVTALSNVSLKIHDGEFMVLLGPSGCGKSTLLRTVAGLESADSGGIAIGGEWVTDIPPHRRNVAMVFQNYALYPNLTAYQNIAFPLKAGRIHSGAIDGRVRRVADRVGISELLLRKPQQLSGGQRQRVAIARAIVREPQVFLMDEPLSNLDAQLRARMRGELTRLQRDLKTTMIYVTHDQVEAMTMAHRIAVMQAGEIQQIGKPVDLYVRPKNAFVAGFLGAPPMNFMEATVTVRQGQSGISLASAEWISLPHLGGFVPGQELLVGGRPESLQFVDGQWRLAQARVEWVEYSGSETVVVCQVANREWLVKMTGKPSISAGTVLPVTVSAADLYFFDAPTGSLICTLDDWQRRYSTTDAEHRETIPASQ